ncbi:MAG: hypothetical protein ACI9YE_000760 [Psychroserpens sp.]|jgi:hypothetical protein
MKRIFTIAALLIGGSAYAQTDNVGIGTTQPDNSAILDLSSSNKGFLLPRMSETQRLEIKSPAQGLQVFQTNAKSGLYIFDGSAWSVATSANSTSAALDPWLEGGNDITTNTAAFIGTKSNHPLKFKVNNANYGSMNSNGSVFLGIVSGNVNNGSSNVGIGPYTLMQNVTGTNNIAIGNGALLNTTTGSSGTYNMAMGFQALKNNRGSNNIGIGTFALTENTTGNSNTGVGANTLKANTTGDFNFAFGSGALTLNQSGNDNFALGPDALRNLVSGSNNTAIGRWTGRNATGSNNIFIGNEAGSNESGSGKLYIATSNTTTPLIYGDFSAKFVSIGDVAPGTKRESAVTAGGYKLLVEGGILTEKVKVALKSSSDWADYVFEDNYKLMPLSEVEAFTKINKHLPNVPSADEMVNNGLELGQTTKILMEKIEELTLYVIELNKEIELLKKR